MILIKKWRNEQIDVLRQNILLTNKDQKIYYDSIIKPAISAEKPICIIFSFINKKKCIGYGGLTKINWVSKIAEISFLENTKRAKNIKIYERDFVAFLKLIMRIAFVELNLNRLFTETYDIRPAHITILEKMGFKLESRLKHQVFTKGSIVDSLIHGYLREEYIKK